MRTALVSASALLAAVLLTESAYTQTGDITSGGSDVETGKTVGSVPSAPIGHLQPRAKGYVPDSRGDQAEQDGLSRFDAEQQKQDEGFDKKLEQGICRGC